MELSGKDFFLETARNFPVLQQLSKVMQEPEFHQEGDVFTHSAMVCEAMTGLEEWRQLGIQEKRLLLFAAAFHDIGKLRTTKVVDGKISSPNHGRKGADEFRRLWLQEYGTGGLPETVEDREQISWLIRWHGLLQNFLRKERPELMMRRSAKTVKLRMLALLGEADIRGRRYSGIDDSLEQIELFREYAKELDCYEAAPGFPNQYTEIKYLRGELAWYGDCLYEPPAFEVVLMMGLPLSGKDTCLNRLYPGLPVISLDEIRSELSIRPEEGSGRAVALGLERARGYLRKKTSFVWNATNLTRRIREKLCRLFEQYGARVTICNIEAPFRELLRRNQERERKVPENVLERMLDILEIPDPWEAYQIRTIWNVQLVNSPILCYNNQ